MVPGARGGWLRREFWRRIRRLAVAGLVLGTVAAVVSGGAWLFLVALAVPLADPTLRGWVLDALLPRYRGMKEEQQMGRLLAALTPHGYRVLPGVDVGRGKVDQVVVGPTGVFTVQARAYSGTIHARGGRNLQPALEHARRQALEVRRRLERAGLSLWVQGVVAVTAGRLTGPVLARGVAVLHASDVPSFVLGQRGAVSVADVHRAVAAILRGDAPVRVRAISYEEPAGPT